MKVHYKLNGNLLNQSGKTILLPAGNLVLCHHNFTQVMVVIGCLSLMNSLNIFSSCCI